MQNRLPFYERSYVSSVYESFLVIDRFMIYIIRRRINNAFEYILYIVLKYTSKLRTNNFVIELVFQKKKKRI